MLAVQQYLQSRTFAQLEFEHGIGVSFDKAGVKFALNYDQINAKDDDLLAQQCRGLILACSDGRSLSSQAKTNRVSGRLDYGDICPGQTIVVARPFNRFFNEGQGAAAKIDWSDPALKVMEKLDGSLLIGYVDPFTKQWMMSTRGCTEADIPLSDFPQFTFRSLFEKGLRDTCDLSFDQLTARLNPSHTYMFELTSPYSRIVVDYKETRITLLGARDLTTMQEVPLDQIEIGVPRVRAYPLNNLGDVIKWVNEQNPLATEGVVVCDANFNRIKIKNGQYVLLSKTKDKLSASDRNCMEFILLGSDDDILPMLAPELADNLVQMKNSLQWVIRLYDETYRSAKSMADNILPNDKKTFALTLQREFPNYWHAPMYAVYGNKAANMREFIDQNRDGTTWSNSFIDRLLELIKSPKPAI